MNTSRGLDLLCRDPAQHLVKEGSDLCTVEDLSVDLSVGDTSVGDISVGDLSVDDLSVGDISVDDLSVDYQYADYLSVRSVSDVRHGGC